MNRWYTCNKCGATAYDYRMALQHLCNTVYHQLLPVSFR